MAVVELALHLQRLEIMSAMSVSLTQREKRLREKEQYVGGGV
jgi:hypothetical protein